MAKKQQVKRAHIECIFEHPLDLTSSKHVDILVCGDLDENGDAVNVTWTMSDEDAEELGQDWTPSGACLTVALRKHLLTKAHRAAGLKLIPPESSFTETKLWIRAYIDYTLTFVP